MTASPRQTLRFPATLGGHNALVIDDLDGDSKNELYVASTRGILKFKQVTQP